MNNENEIERMAELICPKPHPCESCDFCGRPCGYQETVVKLVNAGIGDKKQAVKEFAEKKVKPLIDVLVELLFSDDESNCRVENCEKPDDIPCGCSICVEENKQLWEIKIDNLITEFYGEDE